jgi:GTP pyrophosphokinase
MPSPGNVPLSFNRDRTERQLDARFEELLAKLRKNRPSEDPWIVRRAYEIATERHRDQWRISGDPYLTHLLEVAHVLADMRLDATTLTRTRNSLFLASKNASARMWPTWSKV